MSYSILPQASEHAIATGRSHQSDGRDRKAPWESQKPESLGGAHEVVDHVSMVTKPPRFTPTSLDRRGNNK